MSKKEYLAPQISVIMIEPQAILAGSGKPANGNFDYQKEISSGDDDPDDVWDTTI